MVGFPFSLFIESYNDFVLIDGTRKTNIYDLSMVVITVVDTLGVSIPTDFLVTSYHQLKDLLIS